MKILIACEYSGLVRDAFLKKGHDAMSCDLLPTESPIRNPKKTGLWLKNLPLLVPSKTENPIWRKTADGKRHSPTHARVKDAKIRSLTYYGIAYAMADQWGSRRRICGSGCSRTPAGAGEIICVIKIHTVRNAGGTFYRT